jgi:hypothetical protein
VPDRTEASIGKTGSRDDEQLKKKASYYLQNYVWMAAKLGIGTSVSTSATLDGYPGFILDFSATQRDLANIHGVLGLMLTLWGKVVPLSCSSDHASSPELQVVREGDYVGTSAEVKIERPEGRPDFSQLILVMPGSATGNMSGRYAAMGRRRRRHRT